MTQLTLEPQIADGTRILKFDRFYAISRYPSRWEVALALLIRKADGREVMIHAYMPPSICSSAYIEDAQEAADKLNRLYELPHSRGNFKADPQLSARQQACIEETKAKYPAPPLYAEPVVG